MIDREEDLKKSFEKELKIECIYFYLVFVLFSFFLFVYFWAKSLE